MNKMRERFEKWVLEAETAPYDIDDAWSGYQAGYQAKQSELVELVKKFGECEVINRGGRYVAVPYGLAEEIRKALIQNTKGI